MSDLDPVDDGADPNPFSDPGPFGFVWIDDVLVECQLIEVDGAHKPEDWDIKKGTKSGGGTSHWKGNKLAEKLKLKFRATDFASFAAMTALLVQVRPKLGEKPPTVTITNAIVNWGGISKINLLTPPSPKWEESKGAWEFEWEFCEYAPSKEEKTGTSDPAKPESAEGGGGKQSPAEKELQQLIQEAKKL